MTAYNQRFSPNHRPRTEGERIRLIVLHATYMASDDAAIARLCDAASQVSCHYYIARNGQITQLVNEENVAWHAGQSRWVFADGEALENLNPHSLGIELGNAGPFGATYPAGPPANLESAPDWSTAEPFTAAQYTALASLLRKLMARYHLTLADVVGHSAIAPTRKTDPGPHFDWDKLHALII